MAVEMSVPLDKLEGLGSPNAIAEFFKEEGIQGHRNVGTSCPVSNYLTREGVTDKGQYVHTSRLDVCLETDYSTLRVVYHNTNVSDFVGNFDNGEYPNLIMEDN